MPLGKCAHCTEYARLTERTQQVSESDERGSTVPTVGSINYEIPEDLHRELKVIAARQGATLKAVVIAALRDYVETAEEPSSPSRVKSNAR
jgi:hypothetical protein